MITCSRCGYKNRLGNIFCSQCRAKLDLSQINEEEMLKPRVPLGRKLLRVVQALGLLLLAAVVLAVYPAALESPPGGQADLQRVRRKLAAVEQGEAAVQVFSEAEINVALAAAAWSRRPVLGFRTESIQAQLRPDAVRVLVRSAWRPGADPSRFSWTFSYGLTLAPAAGTDGAQLAAIRGSCGHLPLPGPLSGLVRPLLARHYQAWRQDYPALDLVRRLELEAGEITAFFGRP